MTDRLSVFSELVAAWTMVIDVRDCGHRDTDIGVGGMSVWHVRDGDGMAQAHRFRSLLSPSSSWNRLTSTTPADGDGRYIYSSEQPTRAGVSVYLSNSQIHRVVTPRANSALVLDRYPRPPHRSTPWTRHQLATPSSMMISSIRQHLRTLGTRCRRERMR